jgi:hypothetical protein
MRILCPLNNKKMKNTILENFKKLSFYDNKLTLTENTILLSENVITDFFKEMSALFGNERALKNEISSLSVEIKDLNGVRMTADDIVSKLKLGTLPAKEYRKLLLSMFRESTNIITKEGIAKQIVLTPKSKALFETLTKDEIIKRLQKTPNNYTQAESEYLFGIYKKNKGKYIKPVKPVIPVEDTHINLPAKQIDDIISDMRNNPKRYPGFIAYEAKINSLTKNEVVRKQFLVDYQIHGAKDMNRLNNEMYQISQNLDKQKWGTVRKFFQNVNDGKIKWKNIGAAIIGMTLLVWLSQGLWVANKGVQWVLNKLQSLTGGGGELNDTEGALN